jgi:formylglycine-generating enzyme required for sulfatase activity
VAQFEQFVKATGYHADPKVMSSKRLTMPVGNYPQGASPEGLLDMAGNVREWTISLWGKDVNKPDFGYPYKAGHL